MRPFTNSVSELHRSWFLGGIIVMAFAVSTGCGGGGGGDNDNNSNDDPDAQVSCTPGDFLGCDGNDAILCDTDGVSTVRSECGTNGCNESSGQCNQCDPTTPVSCQDFRIVTCDESGNIVASEQCTWGCSDAGGTAVCNECVAGEIACQDDALVTCGTDGTIATTETCQHGCNADRSECNECDPLMIACDEDTLVACDVDGTIEVSEDCTHGCSEEHLVCLCEANGATCDPETGIVQSCDATGLPAGAEFCALGCSAAGSDAWCNECSPDTTLCVGDDLQPCGSDGLALPVTECPLGCDVNTPDPNQNRCYSFTPTQLQESDLHLGTVDLSVGGGNTVVIDTEALTIDGQAPPAAVAAAIVAQVDPVTQQPAPNAPEIWVLHYRDISLPIGTLEVVGTRALALVASNNINIGANIGAATLDAGGHGRDPGPGGRARSSAAWSGAPSPDGAHAVSYGCGGEHVGAGGGGHGSAGGTGGFYYIGSDTYAGSTGGGVIDDESMQVLYGGGRGGGATSEGHYAGGGGGALMLVAKRSVYIHRWSTINISGGGGFVWGAGGGAGGSLLIEAPSVSVYGLINAGGGGGSCGELDLSHGGEDGDEGGDGGACASSQGQAGHGGDGGLSDSHPTTLGGSDGTNGHCWVVPFSDYLSGGGGGGGTGRWRIRTGLWTDSLTIGGSATLDVVPCGTSAEDCVDYLDVQ